MEILVCVKRVPDSAENEISVGPGGADIRREDLVYSVNEWDNYAVEEAIQIVERVGGNVTVVSVGDTEAEEIVRREMAMGANQGLLATDAAFTGSDGLGIATILEAVARKTKYDLILTGAQADDGAAQVGGMLGALLDWPYASLVNLIKVEGDKALRIGREIEGGSQEISDIELPCVLSIQTGINEPRYAGIRIQKWRPWRSRCWTAEPWASRRKRSERRAPGSGAWITSSLRRVQAPRCSREVPRKSPASWSIS
jgi:electron transfer flavoprotein beta subunit